MNKDKFRSAVQAVSIILLLLLPAMESYRILLFYLPPGQTGVLAENTEYLLHYLPEYLTGGYMFWLVKVLDFTAGIFSIDSYSIQELLSYFGGTYWSVTLAGIRIVDPLAYLQTAPFIKPLSSEFILAAAIPIVLAAILGRFFCAWICPVNTLFEFSRRIFGKIGSNPDIQLISGDHMRPYILGVGILAPLAGVAIFPFILPYLVMGRFLYSLTVGNILWSALAFLTVLLLIDTFLQRGLWCNYLCPTGLLLALSGKRRLVNIKHDRDLCLGTCNICSKTCSWNANPKDRYSLNCTNCTRCIKKCPVEALSYMKKKGLSK